MSHFVPHSCTLCSFAPNCQSNFSISVDVIKLKQINEGHKTRVHVVIITWKYLRTPWYLSWPMFPADMYTQMYGKMDEAADERPFSPPPPQIWCACALSRFYLTGMACVELVRYCIIPESECFGNFMKISDWSSVIWPHCSCREDIDPFTFQDAWGL